MPDEADDRVEMIKGAHCRPRVLDEVPDADGSRKGDVEKREPLRPFHR